MKENKQITLKIIKYLAILLFFSNSMLAENADSLLSKLHASSGKERIDVLNKLASSYFTISPDKSVKYSTEALEYSRKINDYVSQCKSLRNIGIAYSYLSRYKMALRYFEESYALAKQQGLKSELALSFNSLGNYNYLTGNLGKALDNYKQALKLGEETGSKASLISYINNIGVIYSNMGKNENAIEYYFKSLKISEELKDKAGMAMAYINIGAVYNDTKNYPKAIEFYNNALKLTYDINDLYLRGNTLNNLGNIYAVLGNENKALELYQQSLNIKEKLGDKFGAAVSLGDIGSIYSQMGENNLALTYQLKALKIQHETGNREGEILSQLNIGKTYKNTGNYDEALKNLKIAEELARDFNTKLLLDIYEEQSYLYEKLGKFNDAYTTYKLYKELNDSLFNENSSLQIAELQTKYESEKKDKEISLLLRDKQINELNQNKDLFIRNTLIGGIVLLLIAGIIIINRNRIINKSNTLLEQKISQIAEQKEELKNLNANKDKLLSIISHDLRSPFQALVGYSELLAINIDDLSKEEITEYSQYINSTSHQTLELLENMLEWSRLQLGKIQFNPGRINAEPYICKTIRLLQHSASAKEILIKTDIPRSFFVFADEPMITSALHNLISNAVKFTDRGGSITVEAIARDGFGEISVTDTGIGISRENIPKLFNRNIHFSTKGTADEKGTGLGLELTKELIERNGGQISVESELDKGTKFIFTVPLAI